MVNTSTSYCGLDEITPPFKKKKKILPGFARLGSNIQSEWPAPGSSTRPTGNVSLVFLGRNGRFKFYCKHVVHAPREFLKLAQFFICILERNLSLKLQILQCAKFQMQQLLLWKCLNELEKTNECALSDSRYKKIWRHLLSNRVIFVFLMCLYIYMMQL